jgi:hypothetical protein
MKPQFRVNKNDNKIIVTSKYLTEEKLEKIIQIIKDEASEQVFRDGSSHRRVDCRACGRFNKYLSQANGTDICIVRDQKIPMDGSFLEDILRPFVESGSKTGLPGNATITIVAKVRRKTSRAMSPQELT